MWILTKGKANGQIKQLIVKELKNYRGAVSFNVLYVTLSWLCKSFKKDAHASRDVGLEAAADP